MGIVHADTHARTQTHTRTQNIVRLRFWWSASSSNIHVSRYARLCGPAQKFGDAIIRAEVNRDAFLGNECDFFNRTAK